MPDPLAAALERLPHGPQFRFLDKLISLEPGQSGVGEYTVPADTAFLRGHFPGEPMMPGVLLIEAAAQLAGAIAQSDPAIVPLAALKLSGIRAAKIFGTARPGEVLRIEAQVTARMANLFQAQATASVNGRVVLQTELTMSGESPGPPDQVKSS